MKNFIRNKKDFTITSAVFFILSVSLILILSFLSFGSFQRSLNNIILESTEKYMFNSVDQNNTLIKMLFDKEFENLQTISHFCTVNTVINDNEITSLLRNENSNSTDEFLGLADVDGTLYTGLGKTYNVSDNPAFQQAIKGKSFVSNMFIFEGTGKNSIMLTVPIYLDNDVNGVACRIYNTDYFSDAIGDSMYRGYGTTMIIQRDGSVIAGYDGMEKYNTFFEMLNKREFNYINMTPADFMTAIKKGESGIMVYSNNGNNRYLAYKPTGINGWYTVSLVLASAVDQYEHIFEHAVHLTTINISLLILLSFIIALIMIRFFKFREVEKSRKRFQIVARQSESVIFEYNISTKETYFSENSTDVFGDKDINSYISKVHYDDLVKFEDAEKGIKEFGRFDNIDVRIMGNDLEYKWYKISGETNYNKKGIPVSVIGGIININEQKQEVSKLLAVTKSDLMTRLYNKTGGIEEIKKALEEFPNSKHAFYFIDIDNFKLFNDNFGHDTGDRVIICTADAIKNTFGKNGIAGRYGGDEFVVMLKNIVSDGEARMIAGELLKNVREGNAYNISLSVGISIYPEHGTSYSELMNNADSALYEAKAKGKCTYCLFNPNK